MTGRSGLMLRLQHRRLTKHLRRSLAEQGDPRLSVTAAMRTAGLTTPVLRWSLDGIEQELRTLVKNLVDARAVDEGSGDSLDRLIDDRLQEHLSSLHLLHLQRAGIADQLRAEGRGRLDAAERHLDLVEGRLHFFNRALDSAQAGLLGSDPTSRLDGSGVPAPRGRDATRQEEERRG